MENLIAWGAEPAECAESEMRPLLTHLDAAHNLARWLLRNHAEAEDAVQDAYLRALRHFSRFRGEATKAWILAIVRNCCYDRLKRSRGEGDTVFDEFDEQVHSPGVATLRPEALSLPKPQIEEVRCAVNSLPPHLREVILLREFEGMSYSNISRIVQIPMGTVMSRLNRARQQLRQLLLAGGTGERNRSA